MTRRLYYLLLVMLFATYGVSAQDGPFFQVETVTDASPGWVNVGVYAHDIQDLDGFNLVFGYEPDLLKPSEDLENKFADGSLLVDGILWSVSADHDAGTFEVLFIDIFDRYDFDGDDPTKLFDIQFQYSGFFPADIEFLVDDPTMLVSINGAETNLGLYTFINGGVEPDDAVAGTISMDSIEDAGPGESVMMPIYMEGEGDGFAEIRALSLKVGYHPDQLSYEGVVASDEVNIEFVDNADAGTIELEWAGIDPVDFTEKQIVAYLEFTYNAVGDAEVKFLPGSEVISFDVLNIQMIDGIISPREFDATLSMPHVHKYVGGEVEIPIMIDGIDEDFPALGTVSLRIGFDDTKMNYVGYESDYSTGWDFSAGDDSPLNIELLIFDEDGMELEDGTALITLRFNFTGVGTSPVEFLDGTSFTTPLGVAVPFTYNDGSVTVSVSDEVYSALLDARENTTLELTNPDDNVVTAVTTYPEEFMTEDDEDFGVELINEDWMVDAQFWSSAMIPAGTEMLITYGSTEFHVVMEEDILAEEKFFLSDVILSADPQANVRTALLDHAGVVDEWSFEVVTSPAGYETVIHAAVVTDNGDFAVVEDETAGWNGFWLAQDSVELEVIQTIFTITFVVENEDGEAIEDAVVTFGDWTNDAGDYVFEGVEAGEYTYTVTAEGYFDASGDTEVVDQDITVTVVMELEAYTVTFVVEDQDGAAITDAVVTLGDWTNDAGDYVFEGVVPGEYEYMVTADGYYPAEGDVEVEDDVTVDVTLELIVYTVTFVVEDEDGAAITDAVVTLGDWTNDAGDYVFEDVAPGDYSYSVTADGYFDAAGDVSVADDVTVEVTLEIDDTSVPETGLIQLTIYPNPVRETLNIESDGALIEEVRTIDMLGQVVYSTRVQDYRHSINVTGFRNGVYFIQVTTSQGVQTHRVQVAN